MSVWQKCVCIRFDYQRILLDIQEEYSPLSFYMKFQDVFQSTIDDNVSSLIYLSFLPALYDWWSIFTIYINLFYIIKLYYVMSLNYNKYSSYKVPVVF